jgi:hypothetical protein
LKKLYLIFLEKKLIFRLKKLILQKEMIGQRKFPEKKVDSDNLTNSTPQLGNFTLTVEN